MGQQVQKNAIAGSAYWAKDMLDADKTGLSLASFTVSLRRKTATDISFVPATEPVTLLEFDATYEPGQYEFRFTPLYGGTYILQVTPTFADNRGDIWRATFDVVDSITLQNALCTRDQVKAYLENYDGITKDDSIIDQHIDRASDFIQRECGRLFIESSITEYRNGHDVDTLVMGEYPITDASAVQIWESKAFPRVYDATTLLVNGTDYVIESKTGIAQRASGKWAAGMNAIKITYPAGFTVIPPALNWCAVRVVSHWLLSRRMVGTTSINVGDGSVQSYTHDRLPTDVLKTLQLFKSGLVQ